MKNAPMKSPFINPETVPGWGVDADPENDPTYPMKQRTEADHAGYTWARPAQQRSKVEVLHSNERPDLPAIFGTSTPPRGLSGSLRRYAFNYSESSYGHWLPLMLADRVDSAEGVVRDLAHGHVPNVFAERGWNAEWKHNRASLVTRTVVSAAIIGALGAGLMYLMRDSKPQPRRRMRRPMLPSTLPSMRTAPLNPT